MTGAGKSLPAKWPVGVPGRAAWEAVSGRFQVLLLLCPRKTCRARPFLTKLLGDFWGARFGGSPGRGRTLLPFDAAVWELLEAKSDESQGSWRPQPGMRGPLRLPCPVLKLSPESCVSVAQAVPSCA